MKTKIIILLMLFTVLGFTQTANKTPVAANKAPVIDVKQGEVNQLRNEIAEMKDMMKQMENRLEDYPKGFKISDGMLTTLSIIVAVISLVIIVAGVFFVYKNIEFRKEAQKELEEIKKIREYVDKEKKDLVDNIKKDVKPELKTDLETFVGEKLKQFEHDFNARQDFFIDGISEGNEERRKNNFGLAEVYLLREIYKKPKQANAWMNLALVYTGREKYQDALEAVDTALKIDREKPLFNREGNISLKKAEILMDMQKYDEAKEVLEDEVLAINPNFEKAKGLLDDCIEKLSKKPTK